MLHTGAAALHQFSGCERRPIERREANDAPFISTVEYSGAASSPVAPGDVSAPGTGAEKQASLNANGNEGASTGSMQLRSQLTSLKPTLGPPLWRMLPNSLWCIYKGKIDGIKRCWVKGTLISSPEGQVARSARISVVPYPPGSSSFILAANV